MDNINIDSIKSAEVIDTVEGVDAFLRELSNQFDATKQNNATTIEQDESGRLRLVKLAAPMNFSEAVAPPTKEEIKVLAEARGIPWVEGYEDRVIPWWASDERVDRQGDIVLQNWIFDDFANNPLMLYAHKWENPPIGSVLNWEVINRSTRSYTGRSLRLLPLFAMGNQYDWADTIFRLAKARFLRTGSVGFYSDNIIQVRDPSERSRLGLGAQGVVYTSNHLIEWTIAPVPANQGALQTLSMAHKKGLLKKTDLDFVAGIMKSFIQSGSGDLEKMNGVDLRLSEYWKSIFPNKYNIILRPPPPGDPEPAPEEGDPVNLAPSGGGGLGGGGAIGGGAGTTPPPQGQTDEQGGNNTPPPLPQTQPNTTVISSDGKNKPSIEEQNKSEKPPNLRFGILDKRCGICASYKSGNCTKYNTGVDFNMVCDSYSFAQATTSAGNTVLIPVTYNYSPARGVTLLDTLDILEDRLRQHLMETGGDTRKTSDIKTLKQVYQRGETAWNYSDEEERENTTAQDWGYARMNAYLSDLQTLKGMGGDSDLFPANHPKSKYENMIRTTCLKFGRNGCEKYMDGDYVNWKNSTGDRLGFVDAVHKGGIVGNTDYEMEATEQDPVAEIRPYQVDTKKLSDQKMFIPFSRLRSAMNPFPESDDFVTKEQAEKVKSIIEAYNTKATNEKTNTCSLQNGLAIYERGISAYHQDRSAFGGKAASGDQYATKRLMSYLEGLQMQNGWADSHDEDVLPQKHPQSTRLESLNTAKNYMNAYSGVDTLSNTDMRKSAERGLNWVQSLGRGSDDVGMARARTILSGKPLSHDLIRRMHGYFETNNGENTMGFNEGDKNYPSDKRIQWDMWGGDSGKKSIAKMFGDINKIDNKAFEPVGNPGSLRYRMSEAPDRFKNIMRWVRYADVGQITKAMSMSGVKTDMDYGTLSQDMDRLKFVSSILLASEIGGDENSPSNTLKFVRGCISKALQVAMQQEPNMNIEKNCGTGSGGFQAGNTCGSGRSGSSDFSDDETKAEFERVAADNQSFQAKTIGSVVRVQDMINPKKMREYKEKYGNERYMEAAKEAYIATKEYTNYMAAMKNGFYNTNVYTDANAEKFTIDDILKQHADLSDAVRKSEDTQGEAITYEAANAIYQSIRSRTSIISSQLQKVSFGFEESMDKALKNQGLGDLNTKNPHVSRLSQDVIAAKSNVMENYNGQASFLDDIYTDSAVLLTRLTDIDYQKSLKGKKMNIEKNCGTGSGGFQAGNTCGGGKGGGGNDKESEIADAINKTDLSKYTGSNDADRSVGAFDDLTSTGGLYAVQQAETQAEGFNIINNIGSTLVELDANNSASVALNNAMTDYAKATLFGGSDRFDGVDQKHSYSGNVAVGDPSLTTPFSAAKSNENESLETERELLSAFMDYGASYGVNDHLSKMGVGDMATTAAAHGTMYDTGYALSRGVVQSQRERGNNLTAEEESIQINRGKRLVERDVVGKLKQDESRIGKVEAILTKSIKDMRSAVEKNKNITEYNSSIEKHKVAIDKLESYAKSMVSNQRAAIKSSYALINIAVYQGKAPKRSGQEKSFTESDDIEIISRLFTTEVQSVVYEDNDAVARSIAHLFTSIEE